MRKMVRILNRLRVWMVERRMPAEVINRISAAIVEAGGVDSGLL